MRVLVGRGAAGEGAASHFVQRLTISPVRDLGLQTLNSEGEGRGGCEGAPGRYFWYFIVFFRV